jgi:hypothetical protein
MKIVIGASRNNKIGSRLICWWMGTSYSHVYAHWRLESQDREILYEASHGSVHFKKYENFLKDNTVVIEFSIPVTCEQFVKFSQKCIDLAEQKYSKLELLQIFLSDLSQGKWKFKNKTGYVCSELMAELLEDLGIKFNKPAYLLRPDDIIIALRKNSINVAKEI